VFSRGLYAVAIQQSVPFLSLPGVVLDTDRWVEIQIQARLESISLSVIASGTSGVADFLNTGEITSLILPSATWSSASPGWENLVTVAPANVVPVPGAALLAAMGLGYSAWRLRRRTR